MVKSLSISLVNFSGVPESSLLEILYAEQKIQLSLGESSTISSEIAPHTIIFIMKALILLSQTWHWKEFLIKAIKSFE